MFMKSNRIEDAMLRCAGATRFCTIVTTAGMYEEQKVKGMISSASVIGQEVAVKPATQKGTLIRRPAAGTNP